MTKKSDHNLQTILPTKVIQKFRDALLDAYADERRFDKFLTLQLNWRRQHITPDIHNLPTRVLEVINYAVRKKKALALLNAAQEDKPDNKALQSLDQYRTIIDSLTPIEYLSPNNFSSARKAWVAIVHFAQEPAAEKVKDAIASMLSNFQNNSYDSFILGQYMEPGSQIFLVPDGDPVQNPNGWNSERCIWLGLTHIAILLVSQAALESEWFMNDARFLSSRILNSELLKDKLSIIPVLIETSQEQYENCPYLKHVSQAAIAIQSDEPDEIASLIQAQLRILTQYRPPVAPLEDIIQKIVKSSFEEISEELLMSAAQQLDLVIPSAWSFELARTWLMGHLWYAKPSKWYRALEELSDSTNWNKLLDFIYPSWLSPLCAYPLIQISRRNPSSPWIVIQSVNQKFAVKSLMRRAYYQFDAKDIPINSEFFDLHIDPIVLPAISGSIDLWAAETLREFKHLLGFDDTADEKLVIAELTWHLQNYPVIAMIPSPEPDPESWAEALNALRKLGLIDRGDLFPLVLVVVAVNSLETTELALSTARDFWIQLDPEEEQNAAGQYKRIRDQFQKKMPSHPI